MKTGVYKIFLKAKPTKFFIIGTSNIESYWKENGDKSMDYSLIRETNKADLQKFVDHFIERFKPTWDGKPIKEAERAVMPESEVEKAVIPDKAKPKKIYKNKK